MSSTSGNVLSMYRRMLRLVKQMRPEAKKQETLTHIRKEFRSHAGEGDTTRVATLLDKANSSLGYLKIISPRTAVAEGQTGRTKIVFGTKDKDGKAIPTKAVSNWTGANPDPDSVAKHYNQLKRAGFTDNKSVIGPMF